MFRRGAYRFRRARARKDCLQRASLEDFELSANTRIVDALVCLIDNPARLFICLHHLLDLRIVPAKPFAKIVRMEMIGVVGFHIKNADAIAAFVLCIGGDVIISVHAEQVGFFEAEVMCELKAGEGYGATCIRDLIGLP